MNEFFKNKFPFAYQYFSTLIEQVKEGKRKFPQGLIFEGSDTKSQYLFALELARLLNCQKSGENDCDCINCKWIKSFSHPAINNVTEIHFKGDGDESKTVISVKQVKEIERVLTLSSDYHRFFIFFSSNPYEYDAFELNDFNKLGYNSDISYSFKPLKYDTINERAVNALLKSVEEPPEKVTFIFLTKSKEDIIQTIVSRCFSFKLSSKKENIIHSHISDIVSDYPNIDYIQAMEISGKILNILKQDSNLNLEVILNEFISYLKDLMLNNINNKAFYLKLNRDIKFINHAIKMYNWNVSDKVNLETMMLKIVRGY